MTLDNPVFPGVQERRGPVISRDMNQMTATLSVQKSPDLCVVIPVLNERDNIAPLVAAVDTVLAGIAWE